MNMQHAHRYSKNGKPSEGIRRSLRIEAVLAIPSQRKWLWFPRSLLILHLLVVDPRDLRLKSHRANCVGLNKRIIDRLCSDLSGHTIVLEQSF